MKTLIAKPGITAVTIIGLVTLVTLSAHAARTIGRHYNNALSHTEIKTAAPCNYGEVMNSLFGR